MRLRSHRKGDFMKIIVLGGFLGSGKTTLLMQLAKYITLQESAPQVVILENEIGEVGVDNQLLAGAAFSVENIFSGCICCSGAVDLVEGVKKIAHDYHPDWLLIEATGMALPSSIRATLKDSLGLAAAVLCVVDANRWLRIRKASPDFSAEQLKKIDMVVITKIDKVDAEKLAAAEADVRANIKKTELYKVNALEPVDDAVFRALMARARENEEI